MRSATTRLPPVQSIDAAPRRTDGAVVAAVLGFLAVAGATLFVFLACKPNLLFAATTDVGGDNAGHVGAPYFMIHDLLPKGRITGWDPQWFDGFPLYVFYFPLPAVMVAVLNTVFSYAVAFKLVTVLGLVTLPVAAFAFGRLADFRRPVPALMAVATLPFLFNTSYTIEGGNFTSTLAGEYSFSLAITSGLLFLGVFARALRTGRLRWLAALLFTITLLCHVVPAIAFAGVAVLLALSRFDRNAFRVLVPVGAVGALLAAWWLVPFAADLAYTTSMGYTRVEGLRQNFLPLGYVWVFVPAAAGTVFAILRRDRYPIVFAIAAVASVAAFEWLPAGFIYNGRWVPFWFLFTSLLAAYGVGEFFRGLFGWIELPQAGASVAIVLGSLAAAVGAVFAGGIVGVLPGFSPSAGQIQVEGWVSWNYTGFEGKTGWPVYQNIVKMLDAAGARYGCGRLQYEYITETNNPFGSTEATMALPYWTHGCMDTVDGVYFESSTTTPFHFLDQAQYSQPGESSNPISYLAPYPQFDVAAGIRHLRASGVRYFLAVSPQVIDQANHDPLLHKIASTPSFTIPATINNYPVKNPRWTLYLIKGTQLVTPLRYLPEVESGGSVNQWNQTARNWWEAEEYWPVELARSGPPTWPSAKAGTLVPVRRAIAVRPTTVQNVTTTNSTISFTVSRLGTPVLVRTPYFPNWQATGAQGPYDVAPNQMVVIPTAHHVTLTYGTTKADQLGKLLSLVGVVALGSLITLRPPPMRQVPPPRWPRRTPPLRDDDLDEDLDDDLDDAPGPPGAGSDGRPLFGPPLPAAPVAVGDDSDGPSDDSGGRGDDAGAAAVEPGDEGPSPVPLPEPEPQPSPEHVEDPSRERSPLATDGGAGAAASGAEDEPEG